MSDLGQNKNYRTPPLQPCNSGGGGGYVGGDDVDVDVDAGC